MLEIVQKFEPDLIIQGTIYSDALSIGESLGIKVIRTLLWPAIPTDEFPLLTHRAYVIHGAWGKAVQAVENRRDTYLDSILRWEKNIEAINQRRQEIFGLFPLTMEELIDQYDQIPSLVGYSSQYLPVASDWKNAHYTGFWKDLENDCDEKRIDPHLKEFIESGSTPVYIGFGSMINDWIGRDSRFITEMLIRALMTSKQRGVVLYGMAKLSLELLTPENTKSYYELIDYAKKNILFIVAVPHSWLFPRCSVIIHHGGIGTTTTSILSGRPNIIMPVFFDQPIISHGVEKIKAGIKLPNLAGCTYEMIAQAIDTCLTDPSIIAGIKTASDKIMEECKNSLSIATKTIEFLCANYKWPWEIK
jgi:UDP:flavonoid glycosyltransferase YjiC (YdhE family)